MERQPSNAVLIVDDDAAVAGSTAAVLGASGFSCVVVASLQQARDLVEGGFEAGAILVDHRLADGSTRRPGIEELRRLPPIILWSGLGEKKLAEVQVRRGRTLYAYLNKPVPPEDLIAIISDALGRRPQEGRSDR